MLSVVIASGRELVQLAPQSIDVGQLRIALERVRGARKVRDLRVWSLVDKPQATVRCVAERGYSHAGLLHGAQ